jgi:hypothetical protein
MARRASRKRVQPAGSGRLLIWTALVWIAFAFGRHELRTVGALGWPLASAGWPGFMAVAGVWISRGWPVAVFFLFILGCSAAGRRLALLAVSRDRIDALLTLPLGLAVSGSALYALALNRLTFGPVVTVIAFAPLLIPGALAPLRSFPPVPRPSRGLLWWTAALAGAGTLALIALTALAPETGADPLIYHYGKARRILLEHGFVPWPLNIYDLYPSLWEALLAVPLSLGGEGATRLINPLLAAGLAAGVYRLARHSLDRGWSLAASALFLTAPFVIGATIQAKNDLLVAMFGLSAILLCTGTGRLARPGSIFTAGWLAGAAFTAKYTGGYLLPALAAGLFAVGQANLRSLSLLTAGFLAPVLPQLAFGYLASGNPVFPVGHGIFTSPFLGATAAERIKESLYTVTRQDPDFISKWRNFEALWNPAGGESPLLRLAVFLPLAILVPGWARSARFAGTALAILAVVWFAGPPQVRFGALLFPLGAVVAAISLERLGSQWKWAGSGAMAAAILVQAVHTAGSAETRSSLSAGLGLVTPAAHRARALTSLAEIAKTVGEQAGPDSLVLSYGEPRQAVFSRRMRCPAFGLTAFPPYPLVHASRTTAEISRRIRQQGWTHLLYNRLTVFFWKRTAADDGWTGRDLALWTAWWREHARLVAESPTLDLAQGYFYLFRLAPGNSPDPTPARAVMPGTEGWIHLMETDLAGGRPAAARERLAVLRRAAGDFAITDVVEADIFRELMAPERREALLQGAVARGWRSPRVFAELAGYAAARGDARKAESWLSRAFDTEPAITPEAVERMMNAAAREAETPGPQVK